MSGTLHDGISPYAAWRVPGALGYSMRSALANGAPLGIVPLFRRPPRVPMKFPLFADEFLGEMGASRDLRLELATKLGVLLGRVPKGPSELVVPRIRIRYEPKQVADCEEAKAHLAALVAGRGHIAKAFMAFTKTKLVDSKSETIGPGDFRFTTHASILIDVAGSSIRFPKLTWSPMSDAERDALRRFNVALMVHELGHFWVSGMILRYANAREIEGFGNTARAAENDARQLAGEHVKDVTLQLDGDARQGIKGDGDRYDDATKFGVEQREGPNSTFNVEGRSGIPFPGGDNVILDC